MKEYGLLGKSLKHSFSRKWFSNKFQHENIDAQYLNFELENLNSFIELIKKNKKLHGLNVTIPYKKEIIPYLNELHITAQEVGAVNVIKIEHRLGNPYLIGYNTDVWGFEYSLQPLLREQHTNALVLGTGGASLAVLVALKHLGVNATLVSREKKLNSLTYEDITKSVIEKYKLIINTTPLGMYPAENASPEIPYEFLNSEYLLYDLIYNPEITQFLYKGMLQQAKTKNGSEMLELQAQKSWEIWNSK